MDLCLHFRRRAPASLRVFPGPTEAERAGLSTTSLGILGLGILSYGVSHAGAPAASNPAGHIPSTPRCRKVLHGCSDVCCASSLPYRNDVGLMGSVGLNFGAWVDEKTLWLRSMALRKNVLNEYDHSGTRENPAGSRNHQWLGKPSKGELILTTVVLHYPGVDLARR